MRWVIDCGHGGAAPAGRSSPLGGVGPTGLLEKDVTLALGRRLVPRLGGQAWLTRTEDVNLSLAARAEQARARGADGFLSLHVNHGASGERGAETWMHSHANAPSRALANDVHAELARLGYGDRGVHRGDLAVLTPERLGAHTAACLLEVDFLSDAHAERRLRDPAHLDRIADAIARGATRSRIGGPVAEALADTRPATYTFNIAADALPPDRTWDSPNFFINDGRIECDVTGTYSPVGSRDFVVQLYKWWLVASDDLIGPSYVVSAGRPDHLRWTEIPEPGRYFLRVYAPPETYGSALSGTLSVT